MSSSTGLTGCTRARRLPSWHLPTTPPRLVPSHRIHPAADKAAATAGGKVVGATVVTARTVVRTGGPQGRRINPSLTHFAQQWGGRQLQLARRDAVNLS